MIGLFVYGEVSLSLFTAYGVILAFKLLCFMHLKMSAIDCSDANLMPFSILTVFE